MPVPHPGRRPRSAALGALWRGARESVGAFSTHRASWAIPLVLVLLALAGVLGVLAMVPAIAPFVYPLL